MPGDSAIPISLQIAQAWLNILGHGLTLAVALFAALWAYVKLVLERGLLPPAQVSLDCNSIGSQDNQIILEVLMHVKNLGSSTLLVKRPRLEIRYLMENEKTFVHSDDPSDEEGKLFGKIHFPHSLGKEKRSQAAINIDKKEKHTIPILEIEQREDRKEKDRRKEKNRTFVQPGIDQIYTLVTGVPIGTTYVLVRGLFNYDRNFTLLPRICLFVGKCLGLLSYRTIDIKKPHTALRVFKVNYSTLRMVELKYEQSTV